MHALQSILSRAKSAFLDKTRLPYVVLYEHHPVLPYRRLEVSQPVLKCPASPILPLHEMAN
jgi:hypothetical protein